MIANPYQYFRSQMDPRYADARLRGSILEARATGSPRASASMHDARTVAHVGGGVAQSPLARSVPQRPSIT